MPCPSGSFHPAGRKIPFDNFPVEAFAPLGGWIPFREAAEKTVRMERVDLGRTLGPGRSRAPLTDPDESEPAPEEWAAGSLTLI